MKTITRPKNVVLISVDPRYSPEYEQAFDDLSDKIFELSRELYRYKLWEIMEVNHPGFTNEQIFQQFNLHGPLQERTVDEIWVYGSKQSLTSMGGSKAFRMTGKNVEHTEGVHRRFPVMRFSDDELHLKAFAHRVEDTMAHVYRGYPPAKHMWDKYIQTARSVSGIAGCGSVMFPPNGILEGYASKQTFLTNEEDWLTFYPEFKHRTRYVDSSVWGSTEKGYLKWWLYHLPHGVHKTDGIHDNWWHYVMNLDLVR